jgi:hypothetical protein
MWRRIGHATLEFFGSEKQKRRPPEGGASVAGSHYRFSLSAPARALLYLCRTGSSLFEWDYGDDGEGTSDWLHRRFDDPTLPSKKTARKPLVVAGGFALSEPPCGKTQNVPEIQCVSEEMEHHATAVRFTSGPALKLSNGLDTVLSCCGLTFSGIRQSTCCTSPLIGYNCFGLDMKASGPSFS